NVSCPDAVREYRPSRSITAASACGTRAIDLNTTTAASTTSAATSINAAIYGPFQTTAVAPSIFITYTVAPSGYSSPGSRDRALHTSPLSFTRPSCSPTGSSTSAVLPVRASTLVGVGGGVPKRRNSVGRTPSSSTTAETAKT